jgi:hypothetical protein
MHGQSSPVSCILISCFFQSDLALNVLSDFCSAQYVQNMYGSPDRLWHLSSVIPTGDATLASSVGVKLGSCFTSTGLLISDTGVKRAGTERVGSRPVGYERGSAFLILDRDELDEAIDGAISLPPEDDEKVDASDNRERHDEAEDDDDLVLEVAVDIKDEATELRPEPSKLPSNTKSTAKPT